MTTVRKKRVTARSKKEVQALPPFSNEPGKMPVCVLAIDQSSQRPGFAVVNSRGDILHLGSLKFSSKMTHKQVRAATVWEAKRLVELYNPVWIVLEHVDEYRMKKDSNGIWHKTHNTDVIRCFHRIIGSLSDNFDLPILTIPTRTMKAASFRNANATKEDAAYQVSQLYGSPVNHDVGDAWGLGNACFCRDVVLHQEE